MELSLVNKLKQLPIEPTYVVTEKNADILNGLHLLETNREIKSNKVNDLVKAIQEGLLIPPIIVSAGTFTVIEGAHRTSAYRECLRRGIPFTMKARRGTGEADLSPFRRYRIKNWFNSYIEVASLKR